jgi:GT2 family glycosyltransferase
LPLVSFVIPCYRQAHFLPDAVRSALDQTISGIEVVVVDDGSPDDPLAQLAGLTGDPRLVCFRQENLGLAEARNAGVRRSTGTFLSFLDADDWVSPAYCERLLPLLEESAAGFAYCDVTHVGEPGTDLPSDKSDYSVGKSRQVTDGNILPSLLTGGYFPPAAVLVRRSVLDQVGLFDPGLGGHADWELWMRIAAAGYRARYLDEKLAYYRWHGANMSRDLPHMQASRAAALRKLFQACPDAAANAIDNLCQSNQEQFSANQAIWQRVRETGERLAKSLEEARGLRGEVQWLEETKNVFERASQDWRAEAERLRDVESRFAEYFRDTQSHIAGLAQGMRWHEQEAKRWQAEAERLAEVERRFDVYFQETQAWIKSLEQRFNTQGPTETGGGKDWRSRLSALAERLLGSPTGTTKDPGSSQAP